MDQVPSHLRTGTNAVDPGKDETWTDEFMFKVNLMLRTLIENVVETASRYAQKAGRDVMLAEDCQYGLMWEARQFATRPDLERRIEETYATTMRQMLDAFQGPEDETYDAPSDVESDPSKETEEEEDAGSESGSEIESEVAIVPPEDLPPFCRAPDETDPFVRAIHEVVDTWNDWVPDDPVERMLKDAVDRTDASRWYNPVSSDIEETKADGESG